MRIGLDAFAAIGTSGNSTYSREMIRSLIADGVGHEWYAFEYVHDLLRSNTPLSSGAYHNRYVRLSPSYFPLPGLPVINEMVLRTAARLSRIDVMHFTAPLSIQQGSFKRVVTIHDLAVYYDPSWVKVGPGQEFKDKAALMMSSDAIIAVSESTKRDILKRFSVPPEKISVIYEGASEEFYPDNDEVAIESIVGSGRYVLCVGQLQPRKNNIALVRACGVVFKTQKDLKLVFAGRAVSDAYIRDLWTEIKNAGIESKVVIRHDLTNEQLRKLYTRAECLIYPSLFEGFGLPILESLKCGSPVITSNNSSLPEVAGGAGLLVDPYSVDSIVDALHQLLTDTELRKMLCTRIPEQLSKFSWQKAARETINVYESLS
ncbi:MAG: hypothetical protein JWN18_215 [Parcubacteria group bacterium]|nr:hypothetical protein [Parcubacteria group bacterium]